MSNFERAIVSLLVHVAGNGGGCQECGEGLDTPSNDDGEDLGDVLCESGRMLYDSVRIEAAEEFVGDPIPG